MPRNDPIAAARRNWENAGWADVADGMEAVTNVMRAHQILLARVESTLKPHGLSFARFELLRLLAFTGSGTLPVARASNLLQVHLTSVTSAIRRLEAEGLVARRPHPTDGRTTLVAISDSGRMLVDAATLTLNEDVFADLGIGERDLTALNQALTALRRTAGDFG